MIVYLGSNELKKVYLGNTEIKKIYVGENLVYPTLVPSIYQQVEYIQSSGSQYINTGVVSSNGKGIQAKLSSQDVYNDLVFFGCKSDNYRFWVGNVHNDYYGSGVYYGFGSLLTEAPYRPSITANSIVEIGFNYLFSRKCTFNGSVIHSNISDAPQTTIYLFAGNLGGSPNYHSKIRLYSLQISELSNIIRDFVPVYRKSDNVIGLFDVVNQQFYTNNGSGSFTKGPNI